MTDAPALTPRTAVASHDSRSDEVIALKRELATAIAERDESRKMEAIAAAQCEALRKCNAELVADRNALQLALNAASGRADGLEVVLQECRDTFNEYAEIHRAKGESGVSKMLANRALAERCNAALSATPESPYKAALLSCAEVIRRLRTAHATGYIITQDERRFLWTDAGKIEEHARTLLADPQPDTKGRRNG